MTWPYRDYDFIGDRYVSIGDTDTKTAPTECVICAEAENDMYTKYAHPRAHSEAHTQASTAAEAQAAKKTTTDDYIEYYAFFYGREYKRLYTTLYKKYKQEYSVIVLRRSYTGDSVCQYHQESIRYQAECTMCFRNHPHGDGCHHGC